MSMLGDMLLAHRKRWGFTVSQAAWRFGVSPTVYRELEAEKRQPDFDTYERITKFYGWPENVVGQRVAERFTLP